MSTNETNSSITTGTTVASISSSEDERPPVPQTVYTIADLGLRAHPQTQQTIIGPVSDQYFQHFFQSIKTNI